MPKKKKEAKTIEIARKGARKKEAPSKEALEVKEWLSKVRASREVKDQWRKLFRIELAYSYRDGAQRPAGVPEDQWITINKVFSNLLAELPSLYSSDPYFYIKLAKSYSANPMDIALFEQKARIRQSMLNYLKGELRMKAKVRLAVLDAYFQFGIIKTLYKATRIENPDKGKPMADDDGNVIMDDNGNAVMEPDELLANEAYGIKRLHPDDFSFDADAGVLEEDWGLLIERIRNPLEDMKADTRYRKSARKKLKATEIRGDEDRNREERKKGAAEKKADEKKPDVAVAYEIYDLRNKKWLVVSEGCDEYLIEPQAVLKGTEDHPYSYLTLGLLRDDSPYPIPPVSQWLDPQRELCQLRSKILTHRKRFNRKYVMVDAAFDDADDAASKLENGEDGTVLRANSATQGTPVAPIQDATLDQNHIQELIMLRSDFEELATGQNQRGSGSGVDSATEAGIIEKRIMVREGDKLSLVMDFVTGIGRKLDQLVQAYITRDQAVRVTGPQGEYWELIRETDYRAIEGEYEYSVNVGAATPQLPEIERAQWMAFLGLLANAPQLMLSKSLVKKMAELHHIEDEGMLEELFQIAQKMMKGQLPLPGRSGSMPNTADAMTRPASVAGGMAAGINNVRGGAR